MDDTTTALAEAPADAAAPDRPLPFFATLRLARIERSAANPRRTFTPEQLAELTASVRQHGVMQPIIARPHPSGEADRWEIVAGERRYRAAIAAELREIPAMVHHLTDDEVLELALIENLQRADLHPMEEAEGYQRLIDTGRYTADTVGVKIGKSRSYVYQRIKLLDLCDVARKAFYDNKLSFSIALLVARIPHAKLQATAVEEMTRGWDGISFRTASDLLKRRFMLRLADASFSKADAGLVPEAGTCNACPKRTKNAPDLFADVGADDLCTDPTCFAAKRSAHADRVKAAAEERGQTVLTGKDAERARDDYVLLDAGDWTFTGTGKPLKQLLGKGAPTPTLIEQADGTLTPALQKKVVVQALKDKGHQVRESGRPAVDREKERKAQAERLYRERLFATLIPRLAARRHYDLQPIVAATWDRLLHETKSRWLKFRGWSETEAKERIGEADQEQRYYLLVEWSLAGELQVSEYALASKPERMLALAQALEVDAGEIRRAVLDEQRAKAKKPAAKKAAAKKKPAGRPKLRGGGVLGAKPKTAAAPSETSAPSAEPAADPGSEQAFAAGDIVRVRSREHLVGRTPHYLARLPGLRGTVRQTFPDGRLHVQFGPEHQHKRLWMQASELELYPAAHFAAGAPAEAAA